MAPVDSAKDGSSSADAGKPSAACASKTSTKARNPKSEADDIFADDAKKDKDNGDAMPETGLPLFPSAQGIIPGGKIAEKDDAGLFDGLGPTKEELAPGPVKLPAALLGGPTAKKDDEDEAPAGGAPAVDTDMDMFG